MSSCYEIIEPALALESEGEVAPMDGRIHACGAASGATRGLILIAHRASTLKVADSIVVLSLRDRKIVAKVRNLQRGAAYEEKG
jgi:ABC-type transport system involved in Fe-S cluster assembly fused permease/ATPase subunit